uniref:Uncharacterized protein n=1 Tax=Acrobeloides nanus TaxID=290746 RepID=A0A914EMI2_9BILA
MKSEYRAGTSIHDLCIEAKNMLSNVTSEEFDQKLREMNIPISRSLQITLPMLVESIPKTRHLPNEIIFRKCPVRKCLTAVNSLFFAVTVMRKKSLSGSSKKIIINKLSLP